MFILMLFVRIDETNVRLGQKAYVRVRFRPLSPIQAHYEQLILLVLNKSTKSHMLSEL